MVRALAPADRAYRHGLLEGYQVHRLWYVTRLWPGVAHRADAPAPVPWDRVIGCFLWTKGRPRRHRAGLPAGCILYIGPRTAAAVWSGPLPEWQDGGPRFSRTARRIPLHLEWVEP